MFWYPTKYRFIISSSVLSLKPWNLYDPDLFEPASTIIILTPSGGHSNKMAATSGRPNHKMIAVAYLMKILVF